MELKRDELIIIVDNFYNKKENYTSYEDLINLYVETLSQLEETLLKYECKDDSRFVTFGRREFLSQELNSSLEAKVFDQAFYDVIDYVKADTWISLSSIPSELNFQEIIKGDEEYRNSGIICKQEQENILEMINKFRNKTLVTLKEYSVIEAVNDYTDKFGGFPHFAFMGASDETIINAVKTAIKNNKEITLQDSKKDY